MARIIKNPKVSVVLPIKEVELTFLEKSVNSILTQSLSDLELIVVNESKESEIVNWLKKLEKKNKHVSVVTLEKGKNLAYALNAGVKFANGKYIARMDADDIALKDRLKEQVHFIENNKEVDVVGSNILLIGQDGKELKCRQFDENNSSISKKLKMLNPLCHPSVIIKRKALFEVGLYDEDFYAAEDYELWSRFDKNGYKLANLQKVLLKYRIPYNEARNKMNWKYNFLVKVRYFSFDKRILLSLIGLVQALLFLIMPIYVMSKIYKLR